MLALLILKIIGIILLVILGIILFAVSMVLLFPAQYRIDASADGDLEHTEVTAKLVWFLHLISANAEYKDGVYQWRARVFWKKLEEKDTEAEEEHDEVKASSKESNEKRANADGKKKVLDESGVREEKKKNRFQKWIDKIKCTIQKICDKIKEIWKIKERFKELLSDETHRATLKVVKKELFYLIKHYRPRKMKGYVRYGFEDPYHTGLVLAVLSWFYPFFGTKLEIIPEFDQQVIEGKLSVKGYIRGIHLLKTAIRLLFDKNTKQTYEYLMQLKP